VEFALTIVLLMIFILGIIELLMLIYTYNVLADSAKEGVRYAIVHGTGNSNCSGPGSSTSVPPITCADASANNVTAVVTTYAGVSLHSTASPAMTITPTYPDGSCAAPNRVQVTVSYRYQPFFGLFPSGWVTVNAAAEGRITY